MDKKVIMPFHLFTHQGSSYLINIEHMQAIPVDKITSELLERITAEAETQLTPDVEEVLEKLQLISNSEINIKKAEQKEPIPIFMTLFLTEACNLRCAYCYGGCGEYEIGGDMEEETAYRAVDWLMEQSGKMKKLSFDFLGGEPLIKFPLMKAIVHYIEKRAQEENKDLSFRCITNGTLLDEETITFLKDHKITVMISFDGPKQIQDSQRPFANGKGSYDYILPKIKKVLEAIPDAHGHAVVADNVDPNLVKDALLEIGFKQISITPASHSLYTNEQDRKKLERDRECVIRELEQEAEDWVRLTRSRDNEALAKLKIRSGLKYVLVSLLHNKKIYHYCDAGRKMVGVSATGDIYLCNRFIGNDEYKLGSVFDKHLDRKKYQTNPTVDNEKCSVCFARYYCGGGCMHDHLGSTGSISIPAEDMCRLKRRELELAASIVSRLSAGDQAFLFEHDIFTPKPCPLDLF